MSEKIPIRNIYFKRKILPIEIFHNVLDDSYKLSHDLNSPVLSVVIGTKPDFYKQAPVMIEALQQKLPAFVIDTGQHFDDLLGFGIQEFELQDHIACNLQIRGDLMEKASELILKFGSFGRYLKKNFGNLSQLLPIVHGDTLVAGIAPLAAIRPSRIVGVSLSPWRSSERRLPSLSSGDFRAWLAARSVGAGGPGL